MNVQREELIFKHRRCCVSVKLMYDRTCFTGNIIKHQFDYVQLLY